MCEEKMPSLGQIADVNLEASPGEILKLCLDASFQHILHINATPQ